MSLICLKHLSEPVRTLGSCIPAMDGDTSTFNPNSSGRGERDTRRRWETKERHQRGDEIEGSMVGAQGREGWAENLHTQSDK